jgi:hypothetical protein
VRLTRVVGREGCCGEQESILSWAEGVAVVVPNGFLPDQGGVPGHRFWLRPGGSLA